MQAIIIISFILIKLKKEIKIKFQNGLAFGSFNREVFEVNGVTEDFEFLESDQPDFIVFGPYGNDIPKKGNYVRIGYFCENVIPDLSVCEWAFGMPPEEEINHPRYNKIRWHNVNPQSLIKQEPIDIDLMLREKNRFCNFIYANPVPYREAFFKQLSKYKKVDAPSKSMNNMSWPQNNTTDSKWEVKRKLLSTYKFTIAFENYTYPGYHTEKLFDAMLANSLPIYCGDPTIANIFNTNSFVNVQNYTHTNYSKLVRKIEKASQPNFVDIRPKFYQQPQHRLSRKLKLIGRQLKMKLQYGKLDFSGVIDRIIEIDQNPDLYINYLKEPWLKNNTIINTSLSQSVWKQIFNGSE